MLMGWRANLVMWILSSLYTIFACGDDELIWEVKTLRSGGSGYVGLLG